MDKKITIATMMLTLFMFLFPLSELIFLNDIVERKTDLFLFICSQFIAIIISIFFASRLNLLQFNNTEQFGFNSISSFSLQRIFFICSCLFFMIFMTFIFKNVNSLELLSIFAEKYRNGFFKGTGIYTAGMTQFVPLFVAIMLVKVKKLNVFFYLTLAMSLIVSFSLGLRIFLLVICFFLLMRVASSDKSFRAFLIITVLVLFLISFKFFLNDNVRELSIGDVVTHISGRIAYRFLIYDSGFGLDLPNIGAFLPVVNNFYDCGMECFKKEFVTQLPGISTNMFFISNYSGVAIPLPLFIFNVFGFLGWVFIVPFIVLFYLMLKYSFCSKSQIKTIFGILISFYLFAILIEDIAYFLKGDVALVLMVSTNLLMLLLRLRKN